MRWHPADALGYLAIQSAGSYHITLPVEHGRVEMVGPQVPKGAEFSAAFDVALVSAPAGVPFILWQLHDGADVGALNPIAALECQDGRAAFVWRHHVTTPVEKAAVVTYKQPAGSISAHWAINGKTLSDGRGYLRVRRDGLLVLDYVGPLGYTQPGTTADYIKRGVYSWVARTAPIVVGVSA